MFDNYNNLIGIVIRTSEKPEWPSVFARVGSLGGFISNTKRLLKDASTLLHHFI